MNLFFSTAYMDAPEAWQMGFQDPATPVALAIQDLHHDIMFYVIGISIFVVFMLSRTLWHFHYTRNPIPSKIIHGRTLEIVWTVVPAIILLFIAVPSFSLLYSIDKLVHAEVTFKAIGHQWYWTYEFHDYKKPIVFDSYIVQEDDLEKGQLRLLEVDNRVVLPTNTHIRLLVTAADVLHSWAVPSLGVKCDAVPGRLNQVFIYLLREGVFFGQCSELCGANHGFMPIVVEGVQMKDYTQWVLQKMSE